MPVQKFVSTEKHNIDGTTHVGDNNRVFFDVATKTFRLGDGVTPGGIVIAGGGGSGGLTGITDSTTGPVMVLTDVNVKAPRTGSDKSLEEQQKELEEQLKKLAEEKEKARKKAAEE